MNPALVLAALSLAQAGSLYVNGIRADGLRNQEFKDVNVRIDANGDVYIDADRYNIKVADPVPQAPANPLSQAAAVAPGHYWLVTEDNASAGHVVEVRVNGVVVRTIRSGDPQVIIDLAQYLQPGENQVTMVAQPQPYPASGGSMHIFVGPGMNDNGVVRLEKPPVDFIRRSSDNPAGTTQNFTFSVQ